MLRFTIKNDIRTFKANQVIDIDIDKLQYLCVVGNNGCGKSTLFHALRAQFPRKKEINIRINDLQALLKDIKIETDYEEVLFLDTVLDNGSSMDNAYDACSFVQSGGFAGMRLSHGEKQLDLLVTFLAELPQATKKSLIVFDEIDSGFDLRFQKAYHNLIDKLRGKGYHLIIITHNVITMLNSYLVYDLEASKPVSTRDYLNKKIEFDKLL